VVCHATGVQVCRAMSTSSPPPHAAARARRLALIALVCAGVWCEVHCLLIRLCSYAVQATLFLGRRVVRAAPDVATDPPA
jgi:hypothetical protein